MKNIEPVKIHIQLLIIIIQEKKLGNYHQKRVRLIYHSFMIERVVGSLKLLC